MLRRTIVRLNVISDQRQNLLGIEGVKTATNLTMEIGKEIWRAINDEYLRFCDGIVRHKSPIFL